MAGRFCKSTSDPGRLRKDVSVRIAVYLLPIVLVTTVPASGAAPPSPQSVAARIDAIILEAEQAEQPTRVDDATFLRRVSLDIVGRPATPDEIIRFGQSSDPGKRGEVAEDLLASEEYGRNWARYWRDAILLRATNVRASIVREPFEEWMAEQFNDNRSWDAIVTELLTATGKVREQGETALFFAHEGVPEEVAAEASRLFNGIQVQCANCHDHPWDRWKRDEFHEFVAFFPRVSVRRDPQSENRFDYVVSSVNRERRTLAGISPFLLTRIDRNRDRIITEQEAARSPLRRLFANDRIIERIDKNGDGKLAIAEIKTAQPPDNNRPGRGSLEHMMPDLDNPAAEGERVNPVFFLNDRRIRAGSADSKRRSAAARFVTSRGNEWFAKSIVNRIWAELTGTAFYSPVDDIGPDREAVHETALEELCDGFVANGHDLKWLFRTIISTQIYQRDINTTADGFVFMQPSRLRADQLYDLLSQALGVSEIQLPRSPGRPMYARNNGGRAGIADIFGFDPSTPRDDIVESIPQALFMMNSPSLNRLIDGDASDSQIARLRQSLTDDEDIVRELYLLALGRAATDDEVRICCNYITDGASRTESMEDIMWALLNSTEFQTKR